MTPVAVAAAEYGWWLASRAAGLTAMALVTVSVFLGLTLSTRWPMQRLGRKRALMVVHEQAALAGLVSIAVHAIALLGDAFLHPAPYDVIVPFTLDHARVWTGPGVIAMWLGALLGLSASFRQRIGAKRWRSLHRLTLLVYVLALAHALGAGTDAGSPVVRLALLATAAPLLFLACVRMLGGASEGRAHSRA